MTEGMTDEQFNIVLKMIKMILDSCETLDEAKKKVAELINNEKPAK